MAELLIALKDFEKALGVAQHGLLLRPHDWDLLDLSAAALHGLERDTEADEMRRRVQTGLAEQLAFLERGDSSPAPGA
jgi:Flp pilus assembly protein TadD